MGGYLGAVALSLLIITGAAAIAFALGLSALHWILDRRLCLDAAGWAMATYGATALATYDVLTGETGGGTVTWIVGAAVSGFITGRRTCAGLVLILDTGPDPEGPV